MTNPLPPDVLEVRAADQRRRLHNSVVELRATLRDNLREKLAVRRQGRHYLPKLRLRPPSSAWCWATAPPGCLLESKIPAAAPGSHPRQAPWLLCPAVDPADTSCSSPGNSVI